MLDLVLYRIAPPIITGVAGFVTGRYIFPSRPDEAEMRKMLGLPPAEKANETKPTKTVEAAAKKTATPKAAKAA